MDKGKAKIDLGSNGYAHADHYGPTTERRARESGRLVWTDEPCFVCNDEPIENTDMVHS
jgi:hypothetical protein